LAHALVHAAIRQNGVVLIRGTVAALSGRERGVDAVELADGTSFGADVVVNAAGPDAPRIAALAGANLPLDRQPGVFVVTAPTPNCLRHVVRSTDAFLRPEGGDRVVIHRDQYDSTVDESTTASRDLAIARRALPDASRIWPDAAHAEIESVRLGIRAMPKDGYPIVGPDTDVPGLYHVATHSGVTLCARLALLVTEDISGIDVPELAPYRPDRFGSGDRAQVVPAGE
jgi:glycine/D-amino acid oxidase-like deaminating enzyme